MFFFFLSISIIPNLFLFSMKQNEASSFCFKMSGGGIDSLQFQPIRRQILTEPIKRLNFKSNRNKEMTDFLSERKKLQTYWHIHNTGFPRTIKFSEKIKYWWLEFVRRKSILHFPSFYPSHDHDMICHVGHHEGSRSSRTSFSTEFTLIMRIVFLTPI